MRPEDFTIEVFHAGGDEETGCDYGVDIECPARCWGGSLHADTLGEALKAARWHIAEKHAGDADPS